MSDFLNSTVILIALFLHVRLLLTWKRMWNPLRLIFPAVVQAVCEMHAVLDKI